MKRKITITQKKDQKQIMQEFKIHQSRQFIAIAAALFLVLLCGVVYKRPDLFGEYSRNALWGAQAVVIGAFIGFTAMNWRCPSCGKYLGSDIVRRVCRHCGSELQ